MKSLKNCTRSELRKMFEENPEAPPEGISRPQILTAVLVNTFGFDIISKTWSWSEILMRMGQLFNGNRKIKLTYRDLMETAFDFDYIPRPKGETANLNYLVGALTKEAKKRASDRMEREAQEYKERPVDDKVKEMAKEFK